MKRRPAAITRKRIGARLLNRWRDRYGHGGDYAYIYPDGLLVKENRRIAGTSATVAVWHAFPAVIPFDVRTYKGHGNGDSMSEPGTVTRIVVGEPARLMHGIERVEVAFANTSQHMVERGISCTTLTIIDADGGVQTEHLFDFISSTFTVQPDKTGFGREGTLAQIITHADGYPLTRFNDEPLIVHVDETAAVPA